jgi:hypothetical protein
MNCCFIARLRGADARSLARAIAVLLVFNAFLGSFHSGAMASADPGAFTLCSNEGAVAGDAAGPPQEPDGSLEMSCCTLGCAPSPAAIAAGPAVSAAPAVAAGTDPSLGVDYIVPHHRYAASASPRGPPALA